MNHKPCPFCDSTETTARQTEQVYTEKTHGNWHICCLKCDLLGPRGFTEEEAWRLWDQRTEPPIVPKLRTLLVSMKAETHEGRGEYWDGYDKCKDNAYDRLTELLAEYGA